MDNEDRYDATSRILICFTTTHSMCLIKCFTMLVSLFACDMSVAQQADLRFLRPRLVSTPAYRQEVLRQMIEAANEVVSKLGLAEQAPISFSNVVAAYIGWPGQFIHGVAGNFETTNFVYFFTAERLFSGLDRQDLTRSFYDAKAKYSWTIDLLNTNAAMEAAIRIMEAMKMDVSSMNRDCKVSITASMAEDGRHFVPDYWVDWQKPRTNIAHLEFLLPTMSVRSLHVYDAHYIHGRRIDIPNLAAFLAPENTAEAVNREWVFSTNQAVWNEYLKTNLPPH